MEHLLREYSGLVSNEHTLVMVGLVTISLAFILFVLAFVTEEMGFIWVASFLGVIGIVSLIMFVLSWVDIHDSVDDWEEDGEVVVAKGKVEAYIEESGKIKINELSEADKNVYEVDEVVDGCETDVYAVLSDDTVWFCGEHVEEKTGEDEVTSGDWDSRMEEVIKHRDMLSDEVTVSVDELEMTQSEDRQEAYTITYEVEDEFGVEVKGTLDVMKDQVRKGEGETYQLTYRTFYKEVEEEIQEGEWRKEGFKFGKEFDVGLVVPQNIGNEEE